MVRPLCIHVELVWIPSAMFVMLNVQTVAATQAKCSVRLAEIRVPARVKPSAPDNKFPQYAVDGLLSRVIPVIAMPSAAANVSP